MINERKGFTLIEILIVVAIIAILASIVLVGLGPTQQSGRDARRLSDLHEIQNALELFYSKCGFYPNSLAGGTCGTTEPTDWTDLEADVSGVGVTTLPEDPSSNRSYGYAYSADNSSYVLGAALENPNNSVFDGYTPPSTVNYSWIQEVAGGTAIVPDTGCSETLPAGSATYCVTL